MRKVTLAAYYQNTICNVPLTIAHGFEFTEEILLLVSINDIKGFCWGLGVENGLIVDRGVVVSDDDTATESGLDWKLLYLTASKGFILL